MTTSPNSYGVRSDESNSLGQPVSLHTAKVGAVVVGDVVGEMYGVDESQDPSNVHAISH